MSDNEFIDFDPNDSEGDWDPLIPDKEQEQPEKSGSESSGGSDDEEDEVRIVHDPQTVTEPAPKANPRGKQPKQPSSEVIRRSIMPTLVKIPKIVTNVGNGQISYKEELRNCRGNSSKKGQCPRQ